MTKGATSIASDILAALTEDHGLLGGYWAAMVEGSSFDRVAVVVPRGVDAIETATALANLPVPDAGETAGEIWDRLALGVRRAMALKNQSLLMAAAIAWRGRGRVVGPLNPDLLIRFGVSSWR